MASSLLRNNVNNIQPADKTSTWIKEYIFDYGASLKQKETKRPHFRKWSPQLHLRPSFVNFIKYLSDQLCFSHSTCHLCLYMVDQFMDDDHIIRERCLKFFALVCLVLAAKHEESDSQIPKLSILRKVTDIEFSRNDFIFLEFAVMQHFNWELSLPTAVNFCEYHALFAISPSDSLTFGYDAKNLRAILCALTYDYLDIALSEIDFLKFPPSKVAAVCLRAGRVALSLNPRWPKVLEVNTGYSEADLIICHKLLMRSIPFHERKRKKDWGSPDSGFCTDSDSPVSPIGNKRMCFTHPRKL